MKGDAASRPCAARVGDALGGADHQVAAGAQAAGEPPVQRVAHVLVEVDDGVAAEHEVVGRRAGSASRSRSPVSKRTSARELGAGLPAAAVDRSNQRSSARGGASRASSAMKRRRGRARPSGASMSVPRISTRARRDAPRRRSRPACRPRRRRSSRRSSADAAARRGELGEDRRSRQQLPLLRVAPELRDVDRHAVEERVELGLVGVQQSPGSRGRSRGAARARRTSGCAAPSGRACTGAGRCRQRGGRPRRTASYSSPARGRATGWSVAVLMPASVGDRGGELAERQHGVGQLRLDDRARHAVDGAGGLGLGQDAAAGVAHGAARPRGRPCPCRSGRPAAGGRRRRSAASAIVRSARGRRPPTAASSVSARRRPSREAQVAAARGEQRACRGRARSPPAASRTVSAEARSSRWASEAVKPGRHVLDDQRAVAQRATAASASARRGRAGRRSSRRSHDLGAGGCAAARGAVERPRGGAGSDAAGRCARAPRAARPRVDLLAQLVDEAGRAARRRRAWRPARTAPSASASTARAPWAGENAETTTTGIGEARVAQRAQDADAVHAGHREVERQHVGPQPRQSRAPRRRRGRRRRRRSRASRSACREQPAHERGVVGDDDARTACAVSGVGCDTAMRGRGCPRGGAARRR